MDKSSGSYGDLVVWRKGLDLAKDLYAITQSFPAQERFGLVSQIRRAAVSVPSNIAEGQARHGKKEFVQFLYVAKGSLAELDTQCILAAELGYLNRERLDRLAASICELQRMIHSLVRRPQETKQPRPGEPLP